MNVSLSASVKAAASVSFRRRLVNSSLRCFSSADDENSLVVPETPYIDKSQPDIDFEKSPPEIYARKMRDIDNKLVFTSSLVPDAPVKLPDDPSELTALDPAHSTWDEGNDDGSGKRIVHIRQLRKRYSQAPLTPELTWTISFEDEGENATKWSNSLMGWKSGADPMHNMTLQMKFDNALQAVNFAKQRGWNYVVDPPRFRRSRHDGATYQDNFLPKLVAEKVVRQGVKCDHFYRTKAGASHYFRPLKFHGDGIVRQHGAAREANVAPDVEGKYKMR